MLDADTRAPRGGSADGDSADGGERAPRGGDGAARWRQARTGAESRGRGDIDAKLPSKRQERVHVIISDFYMQELACHGIATQYMPIRVRCIGMNCGMNSGISWWYVLNTYPHVFNTNSYVFNTYLSVLVCIVLVLRTY